MTTDATNLKESQESTDFIESLTDEQLDRLETAMVMRAIRRKAEEMARERAAHPAPEIRITPRALREAFFARRKEAKAEGLSNGQGWILYADGAAYQCELNLNPYTAAEIEQRSQVGQGHEPPTDPRQLVAAKIAFNQLKAKLLEQKLDGVLADIYSTQTQSAIVGMKFNQPSMVDFEARTRQALRDAATELRQLTTLAQTLEEIDRFYRDPERAELIKERMAGNPITLWMYEGHDPLVSRRKA